jgi:hypothetical protein
MSYPYQNQPGYPPQYPPPPPPRKSNTGLIVGLAAFAAAAVIALVVVLVVKGGDDKTSNSPGAAGGSPGSAGSADTGDSSGSAEAMGKKAVQLIQNHDVAGAEPLLCKADSKFTRSLQALDGKNTTVTYKSTNETGDTAEVNFTLSLDGQSKDNKIKLAKKDGKWCIS